MAVEAQALWVEGPGRVALRTERVTVGAGEVGVRMLWSGVSRGTERLVLEGRVPDSERERMRAPFQTGDFPAPVKYGYCAVGRVEEGPAELVGRAVFALHPHQTFFALPAPAVLPLPDGLPPRRAALAANMETALNAAWDGGAAPGDRIVIVGAGPLGLLLAAILSRLPGADVFICDILAQRRKVAALLGAKFCAPQDAPADCDLAFHVSATPAGLATALGALGREGTLVEMSWHGVGETPLPLGGAFHSKRLRIVSSQVGNLPPARAPRWDFRRRLGVALELLRDDRLDALIDAEVAFADLPARYGDLVRGPGLAPVVRYDPLG
jgi:threonine dehydrogenase-like Zn-dependent dehydrogenase